MTNKIKVIDVLSRKGTWSNTIKRLELDINGVNVVVSVYSTGKRPVQVIIGDSTSNSVENEGKAFDLICSYLQVSAVDILTALKEYTNG